MADKTDRSDSATRPATTTDYFYHGLPVVRMTEVQLRAEVERTSGRSSQSQTVSSAPTFISSLDSLTALYNRDW